MKAVFDNVNRDAADGCLIRRLPVGWVTEAAFESLCRLNRVHWVACSEGILTLSAFLEVFSLQTQAQSYAALLEFTPDTNMLPRPVSEWHSDTNSVEAVLTRNRPSEEGTNLEPKLDLERKDEQSFSFILGKVGTKQAESTLASAWVLTADLMSSMNRDSSARRSPFELADNHIESVFRNTARDSLGDYVKEHYHPSGITEILRDSLLANSYDKRIVSPFSPADAGNPGEAYVKSGGIHVGLRNVWSDNPRAFITFSDKAEIDVTPRNPSITLRNPLYLDYHDHRRAMITSLAVSYPDWQVDKWSIPSVGATISYVYDKGSVNLTAGAGRGDFGSSQGGVASRYGGQIVLYAQCAF